MRFADLRGRRVVLWGWGRETRSVAAKLSEMGVDFAVAVPDESSSDAVVVAGPDGEAALRAADVVIKSPGVPITSPLYVSLATSGVVITSLSDLWIRENAGRTVAVTGSKGKSTTASALCHLLVAGGVDASLRGNIGTSVLTEPSPPSEVVVMELSSYQAQSLTVSPRLVVLTALFPEHQTWHGSAEAYYRDKLNSIRQGVEVVAIPDSDLLAGRVAEEAPSAQMLRMGPSTVWVEDGGDIVWADGTRLDAESVPVIGRHQVVNVALAAMVAEHLGASRAAVLDGIRTFRPLEHRMERIDSADGRTWIDDSLATAPDAVVASLSALSPEDRVAVLVGGDDRGLDVSPLVAYLRAHPDVIPLFSGPVGRRVAQEIPGARVFSSFADAAGWAGSEENAATVVLLCPGAPSFDEFASYEHKSAAFRQVAAGATSAR